MLKIINFQTGAIIAIFNAGDSGGNNAEDRLGKHSYASKVCEKINESGKNNSENPTYVLVDTSGYDLSNIPIVVNNTSKK